MGHREPRRINQHTKESAEVDFQRDQACCLWEEAYGLEGGLALGRSRRCGQEEVAAGVGIGRGK